MILIGRKVLPIFSLIIMQSASLLAQKNGFVVSNDKLITKVEFVTPDIIHVSKYPKGTDFKSLDIAIILHPDKAISVKTTNSKNIVQSNSGSYSISFDKSNSNLTISKGGQTVIKEKVQSGLLENVLDDGKASFKVSQSFDITKEEALYGLGQHQNGIANMRNQRIYMQQKNMDIGIPYLQSTRNYGVFWNNASATNFNDTLNTFTFQSDFGQGIDYYVILGNSSDNVMENLGKLTGKSPMLPLWSFGYIQSKERYQSPEEMLDVVKKYRTLQVPLDAIVQDWQYWGADRNNWNAVAFTNPKYQNVKDYIDSIHQENAKVMISVWPSFGGESDIYKELEKNKLLYSFYTFPVQKNVKVYDAFNPKARDIYWKYMYNNLFKAGIDGWWLDAVEPVQKNIIAGDPDKQGQELAYKDKTINTSNVQTYAGSFQSMANAYPLATVQGVYEHQRADEKNKRAIILTRSGFIGQQRNAAVLWSGDINGTWAVLKAQIPAAINMSYSGMPYWNSDLGGFYTNKFYPKGAKDPKFQELYIRWFQFGVFTAMLRAHGTNIAREIYQFGNAGDKTFDILHQYINLRYTLLPYIYSQTWQTTKTSKPLMKGLAMNYPNDTKVYDNAKEFLFGDNILVSPVTDSITVPNGSTVKHTTYLPTDDDWFDSWTNKKYNGGQEVMQDVSLTQIPLFVKAGTILPLAPVKQFTDIKSFDTLTLKIYSGKNGSFQLYEDEGDNYNYEKGKYATIDLNYDALKNTLTIGDRNGSYNGMKKDKIFNIQLIKTNGIVTSKSISYIGNKVNVLLN